MEIVGLCLEKRKDCGGIIQHDKLNEIRFEDEFGSVTCPSFRCLNDDRKHCYCGTIRSEYKKQFYKHFRKDKKSVKNDVSSIYISNNSLLTSQFIEFGNRSTMSKNNEDTLSQPDVNLLCADRGNEITSNTLDAFEDNSLTIAKNVRSFSVSDNVFFEKRLIHFFRKVALYWFLCLNFLKKNENLDTENFEVVNYKTSLSMATESDFCRKKMVDDLPVIHDMLSDSNNFREKAFTLNWNHHFKMKIFEFICRGVFQHCGNLFDRSPVPRPFSGSVLSVTQTTFSNAVHPIDGSCMVPVERKRMPVSFDVAVTTSKHFELNTCRKTVISSPLVDMPDVISMDSLKIVVSNVAEVGSPKNVKQVAKKEIRGFGLDDENCSLGRSYYIENRLCAFSDVVDDSTDICTEEQDPDHEIQSQFDENIDEYNFFSFVDCCVDDDLKKESATSEGGYYLPPGMLNIEENDYPQYNLWCTPLIVEQEALSRHSPNNIFTEIVDKNTSDHFRPYRLWEPSLATRGDDRITNFCVEDEYSIFSIPYNPDRKPRTIEKTSFYSLWGSPNIIEFLPAIGCVQLVNGTPSASSNNEECSSADSFNLVYEEKSFNILETCDPLTEDLANLKPTMNELMFTDRGAFKYYRKPMICNYEERDAHELLSGYQKPIHFRATSTSQSRSDETNNVDSHCSPSSSSKIDNQVALEGMIDGEKSRNDSKKAVTVAPCYFKPIQPAFKVEMDVPPLLQRSSSGIYYHQDKKLFSFGKEADQQLYNNNNDEKDTFKPKFVVCDNDKACQTENINLNSFTIYANCRSWQNLYCHPSSNQKQVSGRDSADSHSNKQPLLYSLDDVFNFLGQPGLTNIDMKNCIDFDNSF